LNDDSFIDRGRRLDRRSFLARAAATAALTAASTVTANPLHALGLSSLRTAGSADTLGLSTAAELTEVTLHELADGMASGRWTSRRLVEAYLERIARLDRGEHGTNAILELNPDALAIADALDAERRGRGPRSALHGIPILVKDNIGTADRMHTSAGSLALATSIAPRDAFVVERLRAAGCIILGKANMSEWSDARGRDSVGGWSGRGGLTRNPYALDRSASGSSSGAAAAVAANLVPAALGTETLGSIVSPASICGVVGVKPTVGLVSRSGVIPVSYTQDTVGPMCRTVRDAALMLSVIAGPDGRDDATKAAKGKMAADYTRFLDPNGLRGARIGVARNLFGMSLTADRVIEKALEEMREAGAVLVENADIETVEAIWPFDAEVLSFELKASLNEYLKSLGPDAPVKSLADVIAFNERNGDRELGWFGQETFLYAQEKGPLTTPAYQESLRLVRELSRTRGIDATLARHGVDAIVAPTQSPAWLIDVLIGDNTAPTSFVAPAAAGYPSISVPAGNVAGLPVGMLFMGPAWSEGTLLKLAYAFEQRAKARRPPEFLPSIDLNL
jgi:amidase